MYEDSNRDKINMIGACLILYHDINDEKAAKRMTIAYSNNNEKSKSAPSMEKYEFSGYFELIFISYIVLDIQKRYAMLKTALFDSLPKDEGVNSG